MDCDTIAPFYQWIERAAFGNKLRRHRLEFLDTAGGCAAVLVLGDGDGRFLAALAKAYPTLAIDSIELSARMTELARRRLLLDQPQRIRLIRGDALTICFPLTKYDVVYSHFFIDCFSSSQVVTLACRIAKVSKPGARWIISDFRQAPGGWRKFFTGAWLKIMYLFFKMFTGLEQGSLPDHHTALRATGFHLTDQRLGMAGLIASESWLFMGQSFDPESHSDPMRRQSTPDG